MENMLEQILKNQLAIMRALTESLTSVLPELHQRIDVTKFVLSLTRGSPNPVKEETSAVPTERDRWS
jgi:hypothetical protein